jgi:hypothetical protein
MNDYVEEVCRKLRLTVAEYGQKKIDGAILVGSNYDGDQISGLKYINCPTLFGCRMGNVSFEVARFFEDA